MLNEVSLEDLKVYGSHMRVKGSYFTYSVSISGHEEEKCRPRLPVGLTFCVLLSAVTVPSFFLLGTYLAISTSHSPPSVRNVLDHKYSKHLQCIYRNIPENFLFL